MSKRTKLVKLLFFISVGMLFITGCVGTAPQPSVSPNVRYKKKETFKIDIKKDMNIYEKQLVEIAKKAEYKYNQYVELLKPMKKNKQLEENRIPRNMGRRFTFCFDGYVLMLVKKVATNCGYGFDVGNLIMQDSPIIHRCYKNTMAVDILRDIATGYGYDLVINENKMEMKVRYTQ